MFECRLATGFIFKQIVESIKDLVGDVNLDCSTEELSIQCMDSAHVALVSMSLSHSAFEQFRCDRSISLGMNLPNIAKIFKMMGRDDTMVLKAEDSADKLNLMFENDKSGTIADFDLNLMEIEIDQLGVPDAPYKCSIQMPSMELQRILRDLQVMGDTCKLSCTKEGMKFSAEGQLGTGNILTRPNSTSEKEEDHVKIDMEEPVELNVALRYMNFFTKATPLSSKVILRMSPGLPICIEYPIEQMGFIKFYLAPKMDEDEAGAAAGDEEAE